MSPNVTELYGARRKRCHDEFVEPGCSSELHLKDIGLDKLAEQSKDANNIIEKENAPVAEFPTSRSSSPQTHLVALSKPGTGSSNISPDPITAADQDSLSAKSDSSAVPPTTDQAPISASVLAREQVTEQPVKRKRLTKEEKAAKDQEMARKKQVREAEKAARVAEKAQKEVEKRRKAEENDSERKRKAQEKERERRQKADEKERERREKEEEEARKARSQLKLNSFFKVGPSTTPRMSASKVDSVVGFSSPLATPEKRVIAAEETSAYEQIFRPFFVKDQVTVATLPECEMDEETRTAKSRIIEQHVRGERPSSVEVTSFDPIKTLHLPCLRRRGRIHPSVREVIAEFYESSAPQANDPTTTESQNTRIRRTRDALKTVPMKFLGFKADVRPPYFGTVTSHPPGGVESLRKLARRPTARNLLPLNYDYDSEAEWQEEDGEDIDDPDDEDEDVDNDEDMADFLDDSEDAGLARPAFSSGMEPESSGICWEDPHRLGPSSRMDKFRMEIILADHLHRHSGIDPFSTCYWEAASCTTATSTLSGKATATNGNAMAPPPAPSDALQALATSFAPRKATLPPEMREELREMVAANPMLSKVGTIELFSSQHTKCSKASIKATLELVAEKAGKSWKLRAGV